MGIARWPQAERDSVHVVFSAHSLPTRIIDAGDPYDTQVHITARCVAEQAGLAESQWSWSYQSAGRSPEPWLGPQLKDHIAALSNQGVKHILSSPVGFVSDHVETLYDIDIEAQAVAQRCGVRLERTAALNTDAVFIRQLADLVRAKAEAQNWIS